MRCGVFPSLAAGTPFPGVRRGLVMALAWRGATAVTSSDLVDVPRLSFAPGLVNAREGWWGVHSLLGTDLRRGHTQHLNCHGLFPCGGPASSTGGSPCEPEILAHPAWVWPTISGQPRAHEPPTLPHSDTFLQALWTRDRGARSWGSSPSRVRLRTSSRLVTC